MTYKPILFNMPMVQAILDGRKTVTRRVNKELTDYCAQGPKFYAETLDIDCARRTYPVIFRHDDERDFIMAERSCKSVPGDILWVRETWSTQYDGVHDDNGYGEYVYKANGTMLDNSEGISSSRWRPSIHMPREAARIFLRVTDVRVERLQDMTRDDAIAEGVDPTLKNIAPELGYYRLWHKMASIWDSTIPKKDIDLYSWDANPWVWVYKFERCEKPEDWR